MIGSLVDLLYIAASVLFILGLKGLSSPETARRGMLLAEIGMLMAIVGTLLHHDIVSYEWIVAGFLLGSVIGVPIAVLIPMTKLPERIALSHAFGGLAAAMVGVSEYYRHGEELGAIKMGAIGFEVMLGALTFTGSMMAFGKLQGVITGVPVTYRFQNVSNISLFAVTIGSVAYLVYDPSRHALFYAMLGLAFLVGLLFVLPIGGADMPVVISLLNS
ncbi:MAG TPA: NAD(P)(+) transhydrogenase (Re/Si-specific) subunit beta, partial [Methylomirabilota bacterium]|nr:NAD(P)(+) transhydrogenase (Re/Si-specific) subunit beta [Methylomirabilota bacterium]